MLNFVYFHERDPSLFITSNHRLFLFSLAQVIEPKKHYFDHHQQIRSYSSHLNFLAVQAPLGRINL